MVGQGRRMGWSVGGTSVANTDGRRLVKDGRMTDGWMEVVWSAGKGRGLGWRADEQEPLTWPSGW